MKSDLEQDVSSLNEIFNSDMEYGFIPQYDIFFTVNGTTVYKNILNDRKSCFCQRCCLHRFGYQRDFAMLFSKVKYEFSVKYEYVDPATCRLLICRIWEEFLGSYYSLYTPKGHHLLDRINVIISRILQAGLYNEIQKIDVHMMKLKLEMHGEGRPGDSYYPFTLQHLQVAFYILISGHVISLFVLLLEILF